VLGFSGQSSHCMYQFRILILASAVFYYGYEKTSDPAGLFDAHDIIRDSVGNGFVASSIYVKIFV
jgi:hypothetical protein